MMEGCRQATARYCLPTQQAAGKITLSAVGRSPVEPSPLSLLLVCGCFVLGFHGFHGRAPKQRKGRQR